jgi:hypothetical protein
LRIPKRVNNALDWAEEHIRVITVVTALVVVSVAALWMPALAAFVLGVLVGGFVVRRWMARRMARLRAEADDLLRENGALRHEKTVLSQGVIASSGQLTQRLPVIRPADERPAERAPHDRQRHEVERHEVAPSGGERHDTGPHSQSPREEPYGGAPDGRPSGDRAYGGGPYGAGPEADHEDAPRTERFPIIPWDDEASENDGEDTPLMGVMRPRR